MKSLFIKLSTVCSLLACLPTMVLAAEGQPAQPDVRPALEGRKAQLATEFDAQEQACSKVFAVTDCVKAVSARRRNAMAVVRKEENALNDLERRQRERDRMLSLQQKARQREEQVPPPMDPNAETLKQRLRRQQDKLASHGPQSGPKAPTPPKTQVQIDAPTRQQNAADYAARQKAAADRRAARDKKLKEQAKAPADLPTPP